MCCFREEEEEELVRVHFNFVLVRLLIFLEDFVLVFEFRMQIELNIFVVRYEVKRNERGVY